MTSWKLQNIRIGAHRPKGSDFWSISDDHEIDISVNKIEECFIQSGRYEWPVDGLDSIGQQSKESIEKELLF